MRNARRRDLLKVLERISEAALTILAVILLFVMLHSDEDDLAIIVKFGFAAMFCLAMSIRAQWEDRWGDGDDDGLG